jgi:hypothetical protein
VSKDKLLFFALAAAVVAVVLLLTGIPVPATFAVALATVALPALWILVLQHRSRHR